MLAGVGRGGVMWSLIRPSLISHRLAGHPALHARDLFIFSVNAKAAHTLARIVFAALGAAKVGACCLEHTSHTFDAHP